MKKICIVTGTRAEYGLLRVIIDLLNDSPDFELQIIATGMHLSPEFGLTVRNIENDGFYINSKIEMLLSSDTPVGITKSMGVGMIGFADALNKLQPNLLLVLGDRYEIFVAAASAMIARIPIAHLHGGESTEGLIDESIRHSITKMSHFHFVASEEYRKRVIQLGEQPTNVFNVGGLGIDNINQLRLLTCTELEKELNFKFSSRNLLITFHPVTLEKSTSSEQMNELLLALNKFPDVGIIFTMPNADTDGRALFEQINNFCDTRLNACAYTSLGQLRYLSCIQYVDGVVGNSSSGLLEVPTFRKGTINIGDRQRGRLCADSVINCSADSLSIAKSIDLLFSHSFTQLLSKVENPYGNGGASKAVVDILKSRSFDNLLKKSFFDIYKA